MRSERGALETALCDIAENNDASDQGPTMLVVARDILPLIDALEVAVRQAAFAEARKAVEGAREGGIAQADAMVLGSTDAIETMLNGAARGVLIAAFDTSLAALDALATPPDTGTP